MPRKTKRQQQVSKIPRKKGRYASQEQVITEETTTREIETIEESEKETGNDIIIEEWIEGEVVGDLTEGEAVEDWTEESLKEFKEVEKRFITEALHWHDDAANSIRAVYTGNSRTTLWRKNKERKKLNDDAKEMMTLDTFFKKKILRHCTHDHLHHLPFHFQKLHKIHYFPLIIFMYV
ncbi:hypothetical protein RhiirC2_800693 [Rhizophagus irregularis]|uniref:Uncharacterized protein n=1 Tax=Rhizophagus irregularis TaxID=588596 RepID=A0A2N1M3C3_9GLOM|nr:hypothetical protein RhiirC2_803320 [Rhizophagus irregularis]PKK56125.1 hypothetical protein RhiirC2_800693 [Rhizophagus irregularis]